jgi:hypothetical protein
MHFIAELPAGYDGRTRLTLTDDNRVVATHPEQLPLVLQPSGQWVELWTTLVRPAHRSSTC